MADLAQLESALRKADAAGDTEGARILAAEVRKARAAPQDSTLKKALNVDPGVGMAEATLSLGTGAAGAAAGGLAGLGSTLTNAVGLTKKPAGDVVRDVSAALTYQPRTKAGTMITDAAAAPFELLAKGADKAGGAVTDVTGSPLAGTVVNTSINAAPMLVSRGARAVPAESPAAIAARSRAQVMNAPQDAGIAAAREAGLKITPSDASAGPAARIIEGLSGEPKLAKLASKKNAPVINEMIRRDIGLADDVPLSRDALTAIRKEAGQAYEAVKTAGRIEMDAKFKADLYEANKSVNVAAKELKHRADSEFKKTYDGLNVKALDAETIVEEVKNLRADADKAFRTGDKQLGSAYRKAADALDDQLDRHLSKSGDTESVAAYREARQRIAKTYAADKALNEGTGNIDAAVYARELKKGKPLTGEGRQVAEFGQQFPRSTQRTERVGSTGPTYFDLLLGGGAGVLGTLMGGAPGAGALVLGGSRPAMRSGLLSSVVQDSITSPRSYGLPRLRRLQDLLEEIDPRYGAVGTAEGQRQ